MFSFWPNQLKKEMLFVWMILSPWLLVSKDRRRFLARAIEVTYDVKFRNLFQQSLKTLFKAFKQLCCNLVVAVQILSLNLSISTYLHSVYTDQLHLTPQYQDISLLRGSTAKKSQRRWMTRLLKDESGFNVTGLNQSSTVSEKELSLICNG